VRWRGRDRTWTSTWPIAPQCLSSHMGPPTGNTSNTTTPARATGQGSPRIPTVYHMMSGRAIPSNTNQCKVNHSHVSSAQVVAPNARHCCYWSLLARDVQFVIDLSGGVSLQSSNHGATDFGVLCIVWSAGQTSKSKGTDIGLFYSSDWRKQPDCRSEDLR
jgi:hypothetical protein